MPEPAAPLTVYGIPNCDQVRKALRWLDAAHRAYRFHDLRADHVGAARLGTWLESSAWDILVNTQSTTWRKLDASERPTDPRSALAAMLKHPTLIKRPIFERGQNILVGFKEATLKEFLDRA